MPNENTAVDKTIKPSVCPLDCPDTCSLSVEVKDGRILSVKGSDANPFTAGVICSKVTRFYPEFVHGPRRLKTPLKRSGKKGSRQFHPISWPRALDIIYEKFTAIIEQHGAEAIAPFNYAGPHGQLAGGSMDMRFFHRLGASQLYRRSLCAGIWDEAYSSLFGAIPAMSPDQALSAKLILIWGKNTAVSHLHLHRVIKTFREQGGKLIVVDPRRTKIASQADLHLPLVPGTDVVLAFAVAALLERNRGIDEEFVSRHVIGYEAFMQQARQYTPEKAAEICGLDGEDIYRLADMFQSLNPAAINVGIAPERNRCGGAGVRAALALPALAGKFGVKGGGVIGRSGRLFPTTGERLQRPDLAERATRTLNILDIPQWIVDPPDAKPVKGLFIYNHDPISVHPDQNRLRAALSEETLFTVGCNVEMNDSMAYADIVLPACSHFEHDEIYTAYGQQYLQRAEPVISPVGEALPNTEIFRRLAMRFGFTDSAFTASDQQLMDEALDLSELGMSGSAVHQLPIDRAVEITIDGEDAIMFKNVFPATNSGKIELISEDLEKRFQQPVPVFQPMEKHFPLILITPASMKRTNATFGGAVANTAIQELEMHPSDAGQRGLSDGQLVQVWNDIGKVQLRLKICNDIRRGVVCCAKGAWSETSATGQSCNALISSSRSDIGDGACYNDAAVEVSAWPGDEGAIKRSA